MPPFAANWAFFLDLDGTLLEIAETPDAVGIGPDEKRLVEKLVAGAGGAVAVISGRALARIDQILAPLVLPAAGQHGAERRDAKGVRHRHRFQANVLRPVAVGIRSFAAQHQGLVFEDKGASVALHYRKAPHLEQACIEAMNYAVSHVDTNAPGFSVLRGKMVVEAKAALADKGDAIAAFMREAPFAGRRPVFVGDDVTDEAGFNWVQTLGGGLGIKIGEGESRAQMRLDNPAALHQWLEQALRAASRV